MLIKFLIIFKFNLKLNLLLIDLVYAHIFKFIVATNQKKNTYTKCPP
jgi:hypothetical protein